MLYIYIFRSCWLNCLAQGVNLAQLFGWLNCFGSIVSAQGVWLNCFGSRCLAQRCWLKVCGSNMLARACSLHLCLMFSPCRQQWPHPCILLLQKNRGTLKPLSIHQLMLCRYPEARSNISVTRDKSHKRQLATLQPCHHKAHSDASSHPSLPLHEVTLMVSPSASYHL